jgi:16S rRNA (guanine1207-N2)-methyltransferase
LNALNALFYIFNDYQNRFNLAGQSGLFVNAQPHPDLPSKIDSVQWLRGVHDDLLEGSGTVFKTCPGVSDAHKEGAYDFAILLYPKAHKDALYLLSQSVSFLKEGGVLFAAGSNDAGGARIAKDLKSLGFDPSAYSKFKSRVCMCTKPDKALVNSDTLESYAAHGVLQKQKDIGFYTQAGLFGWRKIDQGSRLLLSTIDTPLTGKGADFGCGYGYIAKNILQDNADIDQIHAVDVDYRALEACRKNLEEFTDGFSTHWHDLTKGSPVRGLDWAVMNPPFHQDKDLAIHVGEKCIESAAQSLRAGGKLYMVANRHLPYEKVLGGLFHSYQAVIEEKGFKVFHARK